MNDNILLSFFPHTDKIKEIRSNQKEALNQIWDAIQNGDKHITICAPVGAGKSAIADTLFSYYNSLDKICLYTSPLNQLVDQVEESQFSNVCTIKGRSAKNTKTGKPEYPCLSGKYDCGLGWCRINRCPNSKRVRECKETPYGACKYCMCWKCIYKTAFNRFRNSKKGNTNFTMFMLGATNNYDVLCIDECDQIEGTIRDHNAVTIPLLINDPEFSNHIEPLKEYQKILDEKADKINPDESEESYREREALLNLSGKISFILDDYESYGEEWCIWVKPELEKTRYAPVTIDRFLEPLLQDKIVIMMSATPPSFEGYTVIEVGSTFPVETRQWKYTPLGRMSYKYRDRNIPKVALWLSQLNGKTLVHCVSYDTANKISLELRKLGVYPLLQIGKNINGDKDNEDQYTVSRYDAVEAFIRAENQDKILLSVKLDRGVDFWQPEIINNVIAVIPYPNPTDPLTKAKNQLLGNSWQNEKIAQDIMQQYGRIHRNELMGVYKGSSIPKKTYIVDLNFGNFYNVNKELFKKWFIEARIK
jgi:hypothetical protein